MNRLKKYREDLAKRLERQSKCQHVYGYGHTEDYLICVYCNHSTSDVSLFDADRYLEGIENRFSTKDK